MFGPDIGGIIAGNLIAILMGGNARRRVIAEMAMDIDDTRRHPQACAVHDCRALRHVNGLAHGLDPAIGEIDHAIIDPTALAVINGRALNNGRAPRIGPVGRWKRVWIEDRDRIAFLGGGAVAGALAASGGASE